MSDIYLLVTCLAILFAWLYTMRVKEKQIEEERKEWGYERVAWNEERQQLLDRIQAPSFDHLKQAEIRMVKAQKEEPPVKYELV